MCIGKVYHTRKQFLYLIIITIFDILGKIVQAVQSLSHAAMSETFYDPAKAFDFTLLRVQHIVETLGDERNYFLRNDQFYQLQGLYNFVKGEVLHKMACSYFSLTECESAITYLEKSKDIRKRLYPNGHTDIVRSAISLGNVYDTMQYIHSTYKSYHEMELCLMNAIAIYREALDLLQNLSPSGVHADMWKIQSNIGKIWYEHGRLLKLQGGQSEDELALVPFIIAEQYLRQSLETENELELHGLYDTSVTLVCLGELQVSIKQHEGAITTLENALEIRKILKGNHRDTVIVMFKLGKALVDAENFRRASQYYKEAFEMEEKLRHDCHSNLRYEIRNELMYAYEMWARVDGDPEEVQRINKERKEIEEVLKKLVSL